MKKIILCLITITIGLSAQAFSWMNSPYSTYQNINPVQTTQVVDYNNTVQPYGQPYTQTYIQTPYQTQCQYPGQYINPYQYQRYGYGTVYPTVNPVLNGLNTIGGGNQIVKNIGRSMIYSMLRGY